VSLTDGSDPGSGSRVGIERNPGDAAQEQASGAPSDLRNESVTMRSKEEVISLLTKPGVIAVVRASKSEQVLPLAKALLAGGVVAIEITTTTPQAIEVINELTKNIGADAVIGVGTVLDAATTCRAIEAGAEFVVSPVLRPEIAKAAREADRPVMLGAFTPTEAQLAHEAGSDFVKIFPADTLGPNYVKAILAPLPHLRIVPTGIGRPEDVTRFIQAGCAAVGIGSLLVPQTALREGNWPEFSRLARQFVTLVEQARQG
jgi:2-dehydro-3-deoxyphosphogluconate aldolase / (4S)-4-hydroxy-2-oxoglutarate aldolase